MYKTRVFSRFSLAFIIVSLFLVSCNSSKETDSEEIVDPNKPSFDEVIGIDFYEVKRSFENGISWDSIGFVQVPEWHMRFEAGDSIYIYSPVLDEMLGYPMYHDHKDYFHFGRSSWRIIELHPDSVMMQKLTLKGLTVDKVRSNVFMKFYSKEYLEKNYPGVSLEELRKPSRQDTLFVKSMVERSNRNSHNPDSVFASPQYAKIKSKHPNLTLVKRKIDNIDLTEKTPSYEYLYPEYTVTLENAYRNFNYVFSVIIDETGFIRLGQVYELDEFLEKRTEVVQGIIDVYLQNLLEIEPAETLGMKHSSIAFFYMKGIRSKELDGQPEKDFPEPLN